MAISLVGLYVLSLLPGICKNIYKWCKYYLFGVVTLDHTFYMRVFLAKKD